MEFVLKKLAQNLAIFDVGNCDDECESVTPLSYITSKNVKKVCTFLKISELRNLEQTPYFHTIS